MFCIIHVFTGTHSKMKRKAKNLNSECDTDSNVTKNNIEEKIAGGKKKKVKFEKSLNKKPTGNNENRHIPKVITCKNKSKNNKNIFQIKM